MSAIMNYIPCVTMFLAVRVELFNFQIPVSVLRLAVPVTLLRMPSHVEVCRS
jgi:hypothetical protein